MNEIANELISDIKRFGRITLPWGIDFQSGSQVIAEVESREAKINSELDKLTKVSLSRIENLKHAERLLNLETEKCNLLKFLEK